jgi:hypothetical protein
MYQVVLGFALVIALASSGAQAEPAGPAPQWQVIVACAAGYHANYENRMSIRAPSMSDSIADQAADYRAVAVSLHQKQEKSALEDATRQIDAYIAANVARFIAMDKVGTLEPFLDSCPDIEVEPAK